MLRRKTRDTSDSLESGYGLNISSGLPMKKLTTMRKLIQFCVLVILLIALHAMYRVMYQTNLKDVDVQNTDTGSEKLEKSIEHLDINVEREQKNDDIREENIDAKKEINDINEFKDEHINRGENVDSVVKKDKKDELIEAIEKSLADNDKKIDDETKDKAIEMKLHPNNPVEKKELEREIDIEQNIAVIGKEVEEEEEVKDENKEDNVQVEEEVKENEHDVDDIVKKTKHFFAKQKEMEKMNKEKKETIIIEKSDHHSHKLLPIVTAASQDTYGAIEQLVESFQSLHPKEIIYIYDLDLTDEQRKRLMRLCCVRMRSFWRTLFPDYVSDVKKTLWRPLIIQVALSQHGHIIWIDPGWVLTSNFESLIHQSEEPGVLLIGMREFHTTYAVTHPTMYRFIPTDEQKLKSTPHISIRAMIIHKNERVILNFLNKLVGCVLEKECIEPTGTHDACNFDFSGKMYANCHKRDESAINIIFKNWYNHKIDKYVTSTNILRRPKENHRLKLKQCRELD